MSANRIVKRRAFAGSQITVATHSAAVRAADRGKASYPPKRVTYHEYAISSGDRHLDFQKAIRAERANHGLQPTSSDMHHVHGQRV